MKDEIMRARQQFHRAYNTSPTFLFVGPEVHSKLCALFTQAHGRAIWSLVGEQAWGMFIHLVPTLGDRFSIA